MIVKGDRRMWSAKVQILLTFACVVCTFLSCYGIALPEKEGPPRYATLFAWVATVLCVLVLTHVVIDFLRYAKPMVLPSNTADALHRLMESVPEFRGAIEPLRRVVLDGNQDPCAEDFRKRVADLSKDYGMYAADCRKKRLTGLGLVLLRETIVVVIVFACLFLTDYTLRGACLEGRTSGFKGIWMPQGGRADWFVEALYYSTVTFVTLGYGEIYPGPHIWPRLLAIMEVSLFLLLFVAGVGFALTAAQQDYLLKPEQFEVAFYDDLRELQSVSEELR